MAREEMMIQNPLSFTFSNKRSNLENIREWHWMWSSFYFYKKNYSYFFAFYKMFGKLIFNDTMTEIYLGNVTVFRTVV